MSATEIKLTDEQLDILKDQLIDNMKSYFMFYAPVLHSDGKDKSSRLLQLWRVFVEYGLGAPAKLFNLWRWSMLGMVGGQNNFVVSLFSPLLAIPLALGRFLRAFVTSIWYSQVNRSLSFDQVSVLVAALLDSKSKAGEK